MQGRIRIPSVKRNNKVWDAFWQTGFGVRILCGLQEKGFRNTGVYDYHQDCLVSFTIMKPHAWPTLQKVKVTPKASEFLKTNTKKW